MCIMNTWGESFTIYPVFLERQLMAACHYTVVSSMHGAHVLKNHINIPNENTNIWNSLDEKTRYQ